MGKFHKAKAISSDFEFEIYRLKTKFFYAGYSNRYMMCQFNKFSVLKEELMI